MTTNREISSLLKKGGKLLELFGENPFKVRSYEKAARTIESIDNTLAEMNAQSIEELDGIGKNIARKILQIIDTGSYDELERLLDKTPPGILELLEIKGIGIQKVRLAWEEKGIVTPRQFLRACESGALSNLKGFGDKTLEKIKQAIEFSLIEEGKFLYSVAESEGNAVLDCLNRLDTVQQAVFTGPLRRRCEILETIDILVQTGDAAHVEKEVRDFEECLIENEKLFTVKSKIPVNIHFALAEHAGSELWKTTGHKAFVEKVQQDRAIRGASEEDVFRMLGLPYIIPEMREAETDPEWAAKLDPGKIISMEMLRGVIHAHTTYSDGKVSLQAMAEHCRKNGYTYLGITDHSKSAYYAGGLKPEDVLRQWEEIDAWNAANTGFLILKGIESDILSDGSLDYEEDLLQGFDFVIASVHSNLQMKKNSATQRVIRAVENPYTTMLGHPSGRLLLSRKGYDLDYPKVLDACAANGVSVEVNANPLRLDLDWRWLRYALDKGIKTSINPDAHTKEGVLDMRFGVNVARKAGVTAGDVINARTADDVLKLLRKY